MVLPLSFAIHALHDHEHDQHHSANVVITSESADCNFCDWFQDRQFFTDAFSFSSIEFQVIIKAEVVEIPSAIFSFKHLCLRGPPSLV
jgi:hypothetical protein